MTNLVEIEQKLTELNKLERKIGELSEQQEKILFDLWNSKKDLAQKINESRYMFGHPTIQYRSPKGPILGFSREENSLYVFSIGEGLRKVNLRTKESTGLTWREIIELGLFDDACEGIKYLDRMVDDYINDDNEVIKKLEEQISKFK